MAKWINREMNTVLSGTFERQKKNPREVSYWQDGDQSYWHHGEQSMMCFLPYLCELCFMIRKANDSMITSKCCAGTSVVRKIPLQMLLDDPKSFLDLKSSKDYLNVINFGQLHFRQNGSDKNHTSLGSWD